MYRDEEEALNFFLQEEFREVIDMNEQQATDLAEQIKEQYPMCGHVRSSRLTAATRRETGS